MSKYSIWSDEDLDLAANSAKVLKEIKLDNLDSLTTTTLDATDGPLSVHNTDVITVAGTPIPEWDAFTVHNDIVTGTLSEDAITVTADDLDLDTSSNGIKQMDLFNGWPEDGDPVTVTVNKNYDDE